MAEKLPFILMCAVLATGLICIVDKLFFARNRALQGQTEKLPRLVDISRSFFPLLLLVLILKSFLIQFISVPTGSLEPTVIPGDTLATNMFAYGLRLPITHQKILNISEPKIGDVVVFRWPVNLKVHFVKRVVAVPGDHISYVNKVLYVNDKPAKQSFISNETDTNGGPSWQVRRMLEDLNGVKHAIYLCPQDATLCPESKLNNFHNLTVPKGYYFMMGDNRDDSDDSRGWGLVPEKNIIGKAYRIVFSWNSQTHNIRWHRLWQKV